MTNETNNETLIKAKAFSAEFLLLKGLGENIGLPLHSGQPCLLVKGKKLAWTFNCSRKKALQSKGLLSVTTAEYIKENNKTVDICAKIHI